MSVTANFVGHVDTRGKLILDDRAGFLAEVRSFAGQPVVKLLAEHCGYELQDMHEALAMKFLRIEDCPITGVPRRKHTPQTDTREFADYVDACIRLAAELGVVIPEPDQVAA